MKIGIHPISYRTGNGTGLEIIELYGNPPLNVKWKIVNEVGAQIESGEIQISNDDWNNWPAGSDNNYIEHIVAGYLGVALL